MKKFNVKKLIQIYTDFSGNKQSDVIESEFTILANETNMGLFYHRALNGRDEDASNAFEVATVDWDGATPKLYLS